MYHDSETDDARLTLEDLLLRRSGLNWSACKLRETAAGMAQPFASRFGWSAERQQAVLDDFSSCAGAAVAD
jgi:glycerol-3-phosphate dehydrogenase